MKLQHVCGRAREWAIAGLIVLGMEGVAHAAAAGSAYIPTMKDMMSIQATLHHYHEGLDKHDNRLMASAFSEEGTLILEAPDHHLVLSGRDQIASKGLMPPPPPGTPSPGGPPPPPSGTPSPGGPPPDIWHFSTNDFYEFVSPTRLKHYAYWLDVIPGPGREATVGNPGHYEDILVKRNGEWLLLERKIIVGRK